jgi:uncharacterized protein YhjY with autotransporter beta-barrel domain
MFQPSNNGVASRFSLSSFRLPSSSICTAVWSALVTLLLALTLMIVASWFNPAYAGVSPCGTLTATVASGGQVQINFPAGCSDFGWNGIVTGPLNGSISAANPATGSNNTYIIYVNNGNGMLTDTFTALDQGGVDTITFNITVSPPTSPLVVSPLSTNPVIGQNFNQQLSTTGGVAPYTYTLQSGALPAGISPITLGGVIAGTPTASGTFSFSVKVTDSSSTPFTLIKTYSMSVPFPSLSVSPSSLPGGMVNVPYSQQLSTSGGTASYTYTFDGHSSLPAGLSLSNSGLIFGTPTTAGTVSAIQFDVTDSTGGSGPATYITPAYSVTIAPAPPPPIVAAVVKTVAYGSSANPVTLALSGGTATSVAIVAPASHGTATVSGTSITYTPVAGYNGPDTFTYTASNAGGTSTPAATVSITVSPGTVALSSPISGASLAATAETTFSQAFTASGGTGPYTFTSSSALPNGLIFSSAQAKISGTPTQAGTYPITVTATDSSTGSPIAGAGNYTLTVAPPTITVTMSAATLERGQSASPQLSATGGVGPYTYAVGPGTLPAGLTLAPATGAITGTPTTAGSFPFTITATDSNGFTGQQAFGGTVGQGAPIVGAVNTTVAYNSGASSYTIAASTTGGTPTSLTVTIPATHGSVASSGATAFTYTPTAGYAGPDSFTYTATNAVGTSTTAAIVSITVSPPTVTLSPAGGSLPATVAASFSQMFSGGGGVANYTYAESGALPNGMSFNASTATLSGTPIQSGSFPISITVTDSSTGTGAPFTHTNNYTLTVAVPTLTIAPATLSPQPQVGIGFSQQITTSGGVSPYVYTMSGTLPPGLNMVSGLISGTPTTVGTYNFTITSTDSSAFFIAQAYSVTVGAGKPVVANSTATVAYGSTGNTVTPSITGGVPTSLTITVPATHGSVASSGATAFTYTPTAGYAGPDSFTYTATNAVGTSTTAAIVSITVSPPTVTLSPAGGSLPATVAASFSQMFSGGGGVANYTYAESGALPNGMSFNASTATLSGTPIQSGSFPISITVTDSSTGTGAPFTHTNNYTLTVAVPTLTIAPATLSPQPQVGIGFSQQITTSGGVSPYVYTMSGTLPPGLNMVSGLISGTPTTVGTYNFTITSTDSSAFFIAQAYSVTVGAGKPVVANSTATVAYGSTGNTVTPPITGGVPISLTIGTTALHGTLSVASASTFTYTPTVGYVGTDSFTYTATNAVGTSAATATVSITISAPTLAITPSATWSVTQGASYTQVLTWSGGTAPYTAINVTGLPPGLSFTSNTPSATISGTPTLNGSFTVTATATDSSTGTGAPFILSRSFTLIVGAAAPVALADTAGTNANQAVTIPVTTNDSGAVTSIAIGTGPTHGNATVSGLTVIYTPATNYFGSDSFTYIDTGPGGPSAAANVAITVAALAAPTSPPQSGSVQPGQSVTLHVGAAAIGGPITAVTIIGAPASGSAAVSGTDIIYTAAGGFSGNVQFTYTLSNAFGTSSAITATIALSAVPVAASQSASGAAASTVLVDLMAGATGGPFIAATVGALNPANAGTATIVNAGAGGSQSFHLRFTAAAACAGTVSVRYTLSNASGPSSSAIVTITIAARTNVANDAQVQAVVTAQSETASRFATAQLGNFSRRLESLHGSGWGHSSFGLGMTQSVAPAKPLLAQWDDDEFDHVLGSPLQAGMRKVGWPLMSQSNDPQNKQNKTATSGDSVLAGLPDLPNKPDDAKQELSLWIAGTVDFGQRNANGQQEGFRFTTNGVSMGADYRVNDKLTLGIGTGYSRDRSDLGDNGSKSVSQSIVATVYSSVRPTPNIFIDGMLGYGALDFDSTRYVTDDGSFATGQRGGKQVFVSLSSGYEFRGASWMWSPYGRVDLASTTLAQYTETASGNNALTYFKQLSRTSSGTLGVRSEGQYLSRFGIWTPRVRIEYRRQFSGADEAGISYADLNTTSPTYVIASNDNFTGNWTAGVGVNLLMSSGLSWILDYSSNLNVGQGRYQSILFGINMPLR